MSSTTTMTTTSTVASAGATNARLIDQDPNKYLTIKKVIVLGLPGSGIDSIGQALKMLDYENIYDSTTAIDRADRDLDLWLEAAKLRGADNAFSKDDFDKLFAHSDVLIGGPSSYMYREIAKSYPYVKFVLWKQEPDGNSLKALLDEVHSKVLAYCDPNFYGKMVEFLKLVCTDKIDYEWVREVIRPQNLLELDNFDSWAPLCEFLGKPIPDIAVPKLNDDRTLMKLAEHRHLAFSNKCRLLALGFLYVFQAAGLIATMFAITKSTLSGDNFSVWSGLSFAALTVGMLALAGYTYEKPLPEIITPVIPKKPAESAAARDPAYIPPHLRYRSAQPAAPAQQAVENQQRGNNQRRNNRQQTCGRQQNNTRNQSRQSPTPTRRPERQVLAGWGNAEVQSQIRGEDIALHDRLRAEAEANKDARVTFEETHVTRTVEDGRKKRTSEKTVNE